MDDLHHIQLTDEVAGLLSESHVGLVLGLAEGVCPLAELDLVLLGHNGGD